MSRTRSPLVEDEGIAAGLVAVDGAAFPLKAARLHARAAGGLASTTLQQDYLNPHTAPLEVIYTMPLPADGAVIGYTVRLGDRVVTGRVETREDAATAYRKALEEGRSAGLLEQERADTFTQKLGSLPPGVEVRVEIEVLHPCTFRAATAGERAEWEYRFPTVCGVRYEGTPGRVEDAGTLDTPRSDSGGTPVRLEADLWIGDGPGEIVAPRAPSHSIHVDSEGEGARVTLVAPSRLDRDVVVRWSAASEEVGVRLVEGSGLAGDKGRYALLTLTPPAAPREVFSRDLTILLDASGSMSGPPLERAKRIAEGLLSDLDSRDRFEMLVFATKVASLTTGAVPATRGAIEDAIRRLRGVVASGATEMTSAIETALAPLRAGSQRQVILITDGEIGFEHEVVAGVLERLPEGARLHVVGISSAPNRTLTRGASRAGRGVEILITSDADVSDGAAHLRDATAAPVLTEVRIAGSAIVGFAPERPRDVFSGDPLRVALELRPEGGTIEIAARLPGGGGRSTGRLTGVGAPWTRPLAGADAPWTHHIEVPPRGAGEEGSGADDPSIAQEISPTAGTVPAAVGSVGEVGSAVGEPSIVEAIPGSEGTSPGAAGSVLGTGGAADTTADLAVAQRSLGLPLGAHYGRERVEDCEMRLAAAGRSLETSSVLQTIESLGLHHRIVTRRTSLVAISEDPSVDPRDPRRRERLTVEVPFEVSAEGVGLSRRAIPCGALMADMAFGEGMPLAEGTRFAKGEVLGGPSSMADQRLASASIGPSRLTSMIETLRRTFGSHRPLITARIVRFISGDLVVFEFEMPGDRFAIPGAGAAVTVRWASGETAEARIVEELGTRPGDCEAGLTVRLALRIEGGWPDPGPPVLAEWESPSNGSVTVELETP